MKKYQVSLSKKEMKELCSLIKKGRQSARTITRARILLLVNSGKTDKEIRETLDLSQWTPQNVRKKYAEGGIKRAIYDAPRSGQPKVTTIEEEVEITALACTEPVDGYGKWTLDLLTEKINIKLKNRKKPLSRGTIHNVLLQSDLKPWREKNVVYRKNNR
ncbi:MAG: helix-turn-helix domain-containing protein [Proteobacteria bacterium]|nr:helix-turn-helix domain-containing protein [Pseudomonadota bacterium]